MNSGGTSNILMSKYIHTQTCRPQSLGLRFEKGAHSTLFAYMREPSMMFVCIMIS